jgi:mannose-1-phosphate guanylyltransferase/mannose-6-phosphate isomerase
MQNYNTTPIPAERPSATFVQRPWGSFKQYAHNQPCTVSLMSVLPGQRLSLQSHTGRAELWIVIDAGAVIQVGETERACHAGEEIWIRANEKHRLSCVGDKPARVLELAFGNWQQADIARFADDFQRPTLGEPAMNCLFQPPLWITVLTLCGQCVFAEEAQVARRVPHLEGLWQIAEGRMDQVPAAFDRTVPVPGLVSLAQPAFVEPGPKVADRQGASQKDPRRDAFWYRRTFQLAAPVPAVAILKVHKAMFGTRVFLNAQLLGEHETTSTETDPAIRQVRRGD